MITAIIIKGKHVVMGDDKPNARQQSPIFSYEGIPGIWTVPFKIPYAENAATFGFPNEPNVMIQPVKLNCQLLFYNTLLVNGDVIVTKCNSKFIYLSAGAPYFDIDLKLPQKNIRDLGWEPIQLVTEPQIYIDIILDDQGAIDDTIYFGTGFAEYEYPRSAGDIFFAVLSGIAEMLNEDVDESGIHASVIGSDTIRLEQVAMGSKNLVFKTSEIYASSIIPSVIVTIDYMSWLTDFHDDLIGYLNSLVDPEVYLSGNIYPNTPIHFPTEFNMGHYGGLNPDFTGFINYYDVNTYKINYHSGESFDGNKFALIPFVFAQTVLAKIFEGTAITIQGIGIEDERFCRLLLDNNHSIGHEWYDPISDKTYIAWSDKVFIENHIPDMTVTKFLDAYRNKFNLFTDYDPIERKLPFLWRDTLITNPKQQDWSKWLIKGEPLREFALIDGIKFSSPVDGTDDFADTRFTYYDDDELQHSDYQIGNGGLEIISEFTHPSMNNVAMPDEEANLQKVPYKNQPGSHDEFEVVRNRFAPSLIYFKGLDVVQNDKKYPYATIDHLNANNEEDGTQMSLIWPKTFEFFWSKWTDFILSTGQSRIVLKLNIADFINFKWLVWRTLEQGDWLPEEFNVIESNQDSMLIEFLLHRVKKMAEF